MAGSRRHLTAMARDLASRPVRLAHEHGLIDPQTRFFDFGCGRGADIAWLQSEGITAAGWDPAHRPQSRKTKSDVVGLTFVVNVIEDPVERVSVVREAWDLAKSLLIVSARLVGERDDSHVKPRSDGWMTNRGTFQRFFEHHELGEWINEVLGASAVPAAPGIWYVFRRTSDREEFLSRRYMMRLPVPHQRKSDKRFQQHRAILQELIDFFAQNGRIPVEEELHFGPQINQAFGSIAKAFRAVEVVTNRDEWLKLAERRRIDLLVYLAMKFFDGSFRMKDLPSTVQRNVRAHFQSLSNATATAEKLLYGVGKLDNISMACRSSGVGKLTPSALYVHIDALEHLPAILKVYEGCARRLIGEIPGANLIKLHRDDKKISYLSYPDFDENPHPGLARSDVVDLVAQRHQARLYKATANVPILHRKEEFVHRSDPRWQPFRDLTNHEVSLGLYADPSRIGYREYWNDLIRSLDPALQGQFLSQTPC